MSQCLVHPNGLLGVIELTSKSKIEKYIENAMSNHVQKAQVLGISRLEFALMQSMCFNLLTTVINLLQDELGENISALEQKSANATINEREEILQAVELYRGYNRAYRQIGQAVDLLRDEIKKLTPEPRDEIVRLTSK
jgi:hypothetical protein